jgi:hypothetical protein
MARVAQLSLAVAGFLSLPVVAGAADIRMPLYRAANCSTCDWSGYYGGINLGMSKDSSTSADNWTWLNNFPKGTLIGIGGGPLFATPTPVSLTNTFNTEYHHGAPGIIGGLQGGYNWQMGRTILGFEADVSGSYQKDKMTYSAQPVPAVFPPLPNFFFAPGTAQGWTSEQRIDWLTTVRARLGWVHGPYMWYLAGGAAVGEIEFKYTLTSSPGNAGLLAGGGPVGPGTFAQFGLPGGIAEQTFRRVRVGGSSEAGSRPESGSCSVGPVVRDTPSNSSTSTWTLVASTI